MTTEAAERNGPSRNVLRGTGANAIYLTTGGLLQSVPAVGGSAVVLMIIATIMLDEGSRPPEDIALARLSLILLTCLIGVTTVTLCFFLGRLHRRLAAALLGTMIHAPVAPWRGWQRALRLGFTPYALRMLAYQGIGLLWGVFTVIAEF